MSKTKYIVEIDEECDVIQQICVKENGTVWTDDSFVSNLEELNSDYINEHFSDLLDTAYQKGFKDGREVGIKDGMFESWEATKKIALMDTETSEKVTGYFGLFRIMENLTPMQAIAKLKAYEEKQADRIEVGDEVVWSDGTTLTVTRVHKLDDDE